MQLRQEIRDTLLNEWMDQGRVDNKAMVVVFMFHPQLCLRIIMGQHQWFEPHISSQQPWWLRAFSHPVKANTSGRRLQKKTKNKILLPGSFVMKILGDFEIYFGALLGWSWESCDRCFMLLFASNCSLFICGVFTEEPWQRPFSVTCRETGIKMLLILILIIPTWNIWNNTAI